MVQSPSWEANWFAASQEIPRILWNPKVHYRTHKRPPPFSILGQPYPVHIPTSHLLEIHPNIIHPSTPRSPQWSLSLRFPHQDPIHPLSSPKHATCPAHLILLDFINHTILGEGYRYYITYLKNIIWKLLQKKTKVFGFVGTDHLRTKIIINDETLEKVSQFTYLGCSISYQFSNDVEFKLANFFTINRYY